MVYPCCWGKWDKVHTWMLRIDPRALFFIWSKEHYLLGEVKAMCLVRPWEEEVIFSGIIRMSMKMEDCFLSFGLTEFFFSFSKYLQLSCQCLHFHSGALSVHFQMSVRDLPCDGRLEFFIFCFLPHSSTPEWIQQCSEMLRLAGERGLGGCPHVITLSVKCDTIEYWVPRKLSLFSNSMSC